MSKDLFFHLVLLICMGILVHHLLCSVELMSDKKCYHTSKLCYECYALQLKNYILPKCQWCILSIFCHSSLCVSYFCFHQICMVNVFFVSYSLIRSTTPIIVTCKTIAIETGKKRVSNIGFKIVINIFCSNDCSTLCGQKWTTPSNTDIMFV